MLTETGVDERIIKKIVGHKGNGVTETVYTHLELDIKLEAINEIYKNKIKKPGKLFFPGYLYSSLCRQRIRSVVYFMQDAQG